MTFNDPAVFGLMTGVGVGGTISSILFAFETSKEKPLKHALVFLKYSTTFFILSGVFLLLKLSFQHDFTLYAGYLFTLLGFIILLIEVQNLEKIRILLIKVYISLRRVKSGTRIPEKPWYE